MTASGAWNPHQLPSQVGKAIVVTGANAGLGYWASEQLARAGAHVILACRNQGRADAAVKAIEARVPEALLSTVTLDVSSLASVATAAETLSELSHIDGLVLNAGIVHPPRTREFSDDGLELVLATNFLGHFALTAQLMPVLKQAPGARVVTLGSMISRLLDSSLEDLQLAGGYNAWRAYAQSKIAMQVFGFELERRLCEAAAIAGTSPNSERVQSLVAHPGYSIGGRTPWVPGVNQPSKLKRFVDNLQAPITQGKDRGAWPIVRAVTDPAAHGGQYWGPQFVVKGAPRLQKPSKTSIDRAIGARVWREAEQLTGVDFSL